MKLGMAKIEDRIFLATEVEGSIVDLSQGAADVDLLNVIGDWKMWQPRLQVRGLRHQGPRLGDR